MNHKLLFLAATTLSLSAMAYAAVATVPKPAPEEARRLTERASAEATTRHADILAEPYSPSAQALRNRTASNPDLAANKASRAAASIPDLRGAVYASDIITSEYDGDMGLYSVKSAETTMIFDGPNALYGGVRVGNMYYTTNYDEYYGSIYVTVYGWDLETGNRTGYANGETNCAAPAGVVYDPTTEMCYGITFNDDATALQLTRLQYTNSSVTATPVAALPGTWNSLVVDAQGQLFGIRTETAVVDGKLVATGSTLNKIDKETAAITPVGPTGKAPQYMSSATIDLKTGRMFWNVMEEGKGSVLCEVDLATGTATDLFAYTKNDEVMGMYVPAPEAEDGAPAAPENLTVSFPEGSMSGTVSFDIPSLCYDGSAAEGDVTYTVTAKGTAVASGTAAVGSHVDAPVTVSEIGDCEFIVFTSNSVGDSPKVKSTVFVGHGVPRNPADIVLTRGENDMMLLSWSPVTSAGDNGYLAPEEVTYTVTRFPGQTTVAENISETSFSEVIPEPETLTSYYYTVMASNNGRNSGAVQSNTIALGKIVPPYLNSFDSPADMGGFTTIDGNHDNKTWQYYSSQYKVYCPYTTADGPVDDWLITPPIQLQGGKTYIVSFTTNAYGPSYPERLEVKWGDAATAEAMTNVILGPTVVDSSTPVAYDGNIRPETDGLYFIGFHGISDRNMFNLYVDDIAVEEAAEIVAPGAVTDFVAEADNNGEFSVSISFAAPAVDLAANALQSIDRIEIARGDVLVKTFENPAPGEELAYTDQVDAGGEYTYTVTPFNSAGSGRAATASVFVGFTRPAAPEGLTIAETETDGEITVTWQPVTQDRNGKTYPEGAITYGVAEPDGEGNWSLIASDLRVLEYTFRALAAGEYDFVQYAVFAFYGEDVYSGNVTDLIPAGTPVENFAESFAEGYLTHPWAQGFTEQAAAWNFCIDSEMPSVGACDADNGFARMYCNTLDGRASLLSSKIDLRGCTNPEVSLFAFNILSENGENNDNNIVSIYAKTAGAGEWTLVKSSPVNELTDKNEWAPMVASLTQFAGQTVEIRIEGTVKSYSNMFFDNIRVGEHADNDAAIRGISAPASVAPGTSYYVDVTVGNNTPADIAGINVDLFADGEKTASFTVDAIRAGRNSLVSFPMQMSMVAEEPIIFSATVSCQGDTNTDNNTSGEVTVAPKHSVYPTVANLKGESTPEGPSLTWDAPVIAGGETATVTENFENADAFADYVDGWTFIDGDQSPIGSLGGYPLPGLTAGVSNASFFVFEPAAAGLADNMTFNAHSGTRFLASVYRADNGLSDEWAISPVLSGNAQTVSFYAKSYNPSWPEKIEICYSTGSLSPADFTVVKTVNAVPGNWTLYDAELPAGARYLAVHSCATGAFMLMLDDFTFEAGSINDMLELKGYDIYRNGEKLNAETLAETAYLDSEAPEGTHTYSVLAVYNLGFSAPVSVDNVEMSGIDSILAGIRVYSDGGRIVIEGAADKAIQVCAADGRTIFSAFAATRTEIGVAEGIYLVTVDGRTVKLIVR